MTLNCNGQLVDLTTPKVMGILNVTPDSFYDGGQYQQERHILERAEQLLTEGATFIDIGGYSSRPNAKEVPEELEIERVTFAVEAVLKRFPKTLVSVDTFRSNVATAVIQSGAALINDISGGDLDDQMMACIAKHQVPYIMMHMRGTPQNMQQKTQYGNLVVDIMKSLSEKVERARQHKINDIVIDPGFGFAKTLEQNYELLEKLALFQNFDVPILIGLSRKSMIYKVLESSPAEALNGTSVLHTIALLKGVKLLRVHDVKEAQECIKLVGQLNSDL